MSKLVSASFIARNVCNDAIVVIDEICSVMERRRWQAVSLLPLLIENKKMPRNMETVGNC